MPKWTLSWRRPVHTPSCRRTAALPAPRNFTPRAMTIQQPQPPEQPSPAAAPAAAASASASPPESAQQGQQPAVQAVACQPPRQKQAQQKDAAQPQPGRCHFFLETKKRYCKFGAVPGHQFCGNHLFFAQGTGPKRVPCPWDPKGGHTVLESELEKHKAKCPGYRQWVAARQQPFYSEDINAGPGPEAEFPSHIKPLEPPPHALAAAAGSDSDEDGGASGGGTAAAAAAPAQEGGGGRKRRRRRAAAGPAALSAAYAASLGEKRFMDLLRRIETACEQICEPEPQSVVIPPEAEPLLLPDSATCNRPFSLKHAQQQASIVGNMQQCGLLGPDAAEVMYVEYGAGKGYLSHMLASCSPARKVVMMDMQGFMQKADRSMRHLDMQRLRCDIKDFDVAQVPGLEGGASPWVAYGKHLCGAATDFTLRSCVRERQAWLQRQQAAGAAGAMATAAPAEASAGAAVVSNSSGSGCSSGCSSDGGAAAAAAALVSIGGVRGLAVATCCHHRCSWRHFVGQEVVAQLGFTPLEFELIAWMTGWALCGHEAPAGFGGSDGEEQQPGEQQEAGADAGAGAEAVGQTESGSGSHKRGRGDASEPAHLPLPPPAAAAAGVAAAPPPSAAAGSGAGAAAAVATAAPSSSGAVPCQPPEWRPQWALPREQRIAAGQRCKRLIDAARLRWLRQQGFEARLVKYVPSTVSGENRLLLAAAPLAAAAAPEAAAAAAAPEAAAASTAAAAAPAAALVPAGQP